VGDTLVDVKIKYSGILNAEALYQGIIDYLDSNGFSMVEKEFKWKENNGKYSVESTIEFDKYYEKDIKASGKIEFKIEDMEDVIVKKNNIQKKLQRAGNVEIKVKIEYSDNYGSDVKDNIEKILLEIYKNVLAKKHFNNIKKKAEEEAANLVKEIKKLLNLHSYIA
jgi:hypothetical protein